MHGRFGEITFQVDESEDHITEGAPNIVNQPDYSHHQEIWGQQESRQLTPIGSGRSHSDEEYYNFDQPVPEKNAKEIKMENGIPDGGKSFRHHTGSGSFSRLTSLYNDLADNNENEIQQDLRWLKAKYQMELRKLRDEQLGIAVKPSTSRNGEGITSNQVSSSSMSNSFQEDSNGDVSKSLTKQVSHNLHGNASKSCALSDTRRHRNHKLMTRSPRPEDMVTVNNFCTGPLLPHSLHRTTSLPVDAVDV
jgi:WNK lysine deficient protein kinase